LREGRRAETNGARCGEAKELRSVAHAVLHSMRLQGVRSFACG
jgi:hypothetical protein